MIQLDSNITISKETEEVLEKLQAIIDCEVSFEDQVTKAQSLWSSMKKKLGEKAFDELKVKLREQCVFVGTCNYCEESESSDIEHIAPKSFFPEQTFKWENYLLACKNCNSGFKLDQCFVLDDLGDVISVPRKIEPPFKELAFINPKTEDPNNFMILDTTYTFKFMVFDDLSKKDQNKAQKTIDILGLDVRDTLIVSRKETAIHLYQRLELLSRILKADSIEEIISMLAPNDDLVDPDVSLEMFKDETKNNFMRQIQKHKHPSVWYAIKKVESKMSPKWKKLFDEIPEALMW
jgi:uncharacterized protein (TIGR02646 family)